MRLLSSQAADPKIPKTPLILSDAAYNAIGDAAEVNTVDELNRMEDYYYSKQISMPSSSGSTLLYANLQETS